jgi:hypothetical protein
MPTQVDRNELQRFVSEGAELVEVLPRELYEHEHIPGAGSTIVTTSDGRLVGLLRREDAERWLQG